MLLLCCTYDFLSGPQCISSLKCPGYKVEKCICTEGFPIVISGLVYCHICLAQRLHRRCNRTQNQHLKAKFHTLKIIFKSCTAKKHFKNYEKQTGTGVTVVTMLLCFDVSMDGGMGRTVLANLAFGPCAGVGVAFPVWA